MTTEMATRTVTLRLWRGDAGGGEYVDYTLPAQEGEVVLDVVHRVQAELAPDLAVRWNCKAGKCGSCSAEVNGRPRLMCMTRMSTLPEDEPITISPMRAFPVMRDLVTDVSYNFAVARKIPPFTPRPRDPDGTYRMQQVDIERGQEFRKCIECFLCQNVCHVTRDHEENKPAYAGPRYFIRLAELEMHPLDTLDRRRYISEEMGIGLCNITKCCTEVCPESIHITDNAIIPLKERVVDARYDPVAWLGRKITGRKNPTPAAQIAALTPAGRSGEVIVTETRQSVAFLSPDYLAELGARLSSAPANKDSPRVGIGQLVIGAPGGDIAYTVQIGGGTPSELTAGSLEGATVTLVIDYETAARLADGGEITSALDEGRIKVRGDVSALVRAYPVVQDALAGLDQS